MNPSELFNGMGAAGTLLMGIGTVAAVAVTVILAIVRSRHKRSKLHTATSGSALANVIINNNPPVYGTQPAELSTSAAATGVADRAHVAPKTQTSVRGSSTSRKVKTEQDIREENAKNALQSLSAMIATVHEYADQYQKQSRAQSPHAQKIAALAALQRALGSRSEDLRNLDFLKSASALDSSLHKLGITWDSDDPREVLFSYLDPLSLQHQPSTMAAMLETFIKEANRIALALEQAGFEVRKSNPWRKPYPVFSVIAAPRQQEDR